MLADAHTPLEHARRTHQTQRAGDADSCFFARGSLLSLLALCREVVEGPPGRKGSNRAIPANGGTAGAGCVGCPVAELVGRRRQTERRTHSSSTGQQGTAGRAFFFKLVCALERVLAVGHAQRLHTHLAHELGLLGVAQRKEGEEKTVDDYHIRFGADARKAISGLPRALPDSPAAASQAGLGHLPLRVDLLQRVGGALPRVHARISKRRLGGVRVGDRLRLHGGRVGLFPLGLPRRGGQDGAQPATHRNTLLALLVSDRRALLPAVGLHPRRQQRLRRCRSADLAAAADAAAGAPF
mmetsp:Transcript_14796/g.34449  ORF Transcript_14796/g.34449 Transcript_14796/m.34449 type:complete len:297 (+) Transcript_14796:1054-1944(+)